MTAVSEKSGVWFVYDGDCPICTHAAQAIRIKQVFGELSTLNARETKDDPLIEEISRLGLDLDEGMVIYNNGRFYHGDGALKFMARYGASGNFFMFFLKSLFWSDTLSRLMYPWMRGIRNWLLRRRNVSRIDNLNLKNEPTFKSIFGQSWDELPPVIKKHYANHSYTTEITSVEGTLDVFCKPPLLWLSPLMKLLGQIPAFNEKNVPVTVHFESEINSKAFHLNRIFNFSNGKPYRFRSRMFQIRGNEVIEIMQFGLGWKTKYFWDGEKVVLAHIGYAVRLFGNLIPLPLTILLGEGNAEEHPVDDNTFDMEVTISHPWWGKLYGYKGRFQVMH